MMKRMISMLILLTALSSGYWWFTRPSAAALEPASLTGSGAIEAETVAITAELGGRILELKVNEGDEVTAGQALVELDQADLLAQRVQLEATLATAKANLELASAAAWPAEVAVAQAQLAQAEVAREGARLTWQRAKALADGPYELEARINQAQARVTEAERNLEMAQVNLKQMEIQAEAAGRNQTTVLGGNEGLVQSQAARTGVEMAEVALAGAKKQVEHLVRLRERPLPLIAQANATTAAYRQAEAAVLAAIANLAAVKADPTPEDIAVAQAQVLEAEAVLAALDIRLAKQTLIAPREGLIGRKLVNPGELAAPGAVLLELNDIETVKLTVYIPETQIGRVKIGQKARVYVDAYPGEAFEGTVSFIAHEAEFTPRNVQTPEERVNLVFAVKISLDNADHRLKPGMPADAILEEWKPGRVEEWKDGRVEDWKNKNKPAILPTFQPLPPSQPTATPTLQVEPEPKTPYGQDEAFQPSSLPTLQPEATPMTQAEIISVGLNVRSGPGIDYPVIATLAQGDIVTVIEVDSDTGWLQVRLPTAEKTGWISGSSTYVAIRMADLS
jgi:multidrug resistance efflux pump